jgi:hypothetical protein
LEFHVILCNLDRNKENRKIIGDYMEIIKIVCPKCKSQEIKERFCYETKNNGTRKPYECCCCETVFSETKNTFLEGLRKPVSLIVMVGKQEQKVWLLMQLVEPLKFLRIHLSFGKAVLPTLKRFFSCFLWLISLSKMVIEDDELYTKVKKNVSPEDSRRWTIVLMERASRFIWFMAVRQERQETKKAIETLCKIIEKTDDITLVTDGERRYGNLLF